MIITFCLYFSLLYLFCFPNQIFEIVYCFAALCSRLAVLQQTSCEMAGICTRQTGAKGMNTKTKRKDWLNRILTCCKGGERDGFSQENFPLLVSEIGGSQSLDQPSSNPIII